MSDFDEIVMPTPDPEPEPEVTPEPEAEVTPEPEPEPPLWEKLGFESEEAFVKKASNMSAWEKEVNRKASLVGAQEKQMVAPEPAPVVDEDGSIWDDLDPTVAKKFKAAIAAEAQAIIASSVGPQAEVATELFNDSAGKAFDAFAASQDLDPTELYTFMSEQNLLPTRPSLQLLEQQMTLAANALKGQNVEALVEKRLTEEMSKLKKDGAHVKAVEPAAMKEPVEADRDEFLSSDFITKLKLMASGKA